MIAKKSVATTAAKFVAATMLAVGPSGCRVEAGTALTAPPPLAVGYSLATHVQPIFTATCAFASCHAGTAPQQGMDLSAGRAYGSIVGVPSTEVPRLLRVAPGDPDSSYLVLKIEGRAGAVGGVGTRMPLGGQLAPVQIETIRAWVAAGAPNN